MTRISDAVERLSTPDFPTLFTGWPKEAYDRTVTGQWECKYCGYKWVEKSSGRGEFTRDDFSDELCEECGSCNTHLTIIDDENHDDCLAEFSRDQCECCGTTLAGSRYAVTALPPDPSVNPDRMTYEVCEDCYYFIGTGEELT